MRHPTYPSFYQINAGVRLTELPKQLGRPATLADIPDSELDRLRQRLPKRDLRLMLDFLSHLARPDPSIASCGC